MGSVLDDRPPNRIPACNTSCESLSVHQAVSPDARSQQESINWSARELPDQFLRPASDFTRSLCTLFPACNWPSSPRPPRAGQSFRLVFRAPALQTFLFLRPSRHPARLWRAPSSSIAMSSANRSMRGAARQLCSSTLRRVRDIFEKRPGALPQSVPVKRAGPHRNTVAKTVQSVGFRPPAVLAGSKLSTYLHTRRLSGHL